MKEKVDGNVIYIAGPMRGLPNFNFEAFDRAEKSLRAEGWEPINPAEMDRELGFDPKTLVCDKEFILGCVRRDSEAIIEQAEALVLLPGWENSVGANAEMWLARWKQIPVYHYPDMSTAVNPDSNV